MNELRFFNPYAEIRHTENRLPHWQQNGATYFVTFRLADSIPANVLGRWRDEREAWLRLHPEPWNFEIELEYHQRFSGALEHWLDQGYGAASSDAMIVQKSSRRHCAILKGNAL
ncbi:MAG TPA: hypothetical protein VE031_04890 [Chthoniobacterales bacterium]|nr:hypothetical protein [Chthoniobacterales bacterium]